MTLYLVASKGGDVSNNSGMTCGAIDEGIVEASGANGVDDADGGNIVSFVDRHACLSTNSSTTSSSTSNRLYPNCNG